MGKLGAGDLTIIFFSILFMYLFIFLRNLKNKNKITSRRAACDWLLGGSEGQFSPWPTGLCGGGGVLGECEQGQGESH